MKEVCGFEGLDGKFYERKKDVELADLEYEIRDVRHKLNNFQSFLGNHLFQYSFGRTKYLKEVDKAIVDRHINNVYNIVAEAILRDSDNFLEVINKKEKLKNTLDELKKKRKHKDTWWLKYKWW